MHRREVSAASKRSKETGVRRVVLVLVLSTTILQSYRTNVLDKKYKLAIIGYFYFCFREPGDIVYHEHEGREEREPRT